MIIAYDARDPLDWAETPKKKFNIEVCLKYFVEELYFRAAQAKSKDERMAIKGVQHALENALMKHGIKVDFRDNFLDKQQK
jgi:hypothetical protein